MEEDFLDPQSMQNNGPKAFRIAQKAIILHTLGVQVRLVLLFFWYGIGALARVNQDPHKEALPKRSRRRVWATIVWSSIITLRVQGTRTWSMCSLFHMQNCNYACGDPLDAWSLENSSTTLIV